MNFDLIAPYYRWLESVAFGNKLQLARVAFLEGSASAKCVLVAGEGDGRFLREVALKFPEARFDCVDASARMLQLARARCRADGGCVRFLQNDFLTWSPEENQYDLIVTHFFLDCFNKHELETVVSTLAKAATSNAVWLLADFSIPQTPLPKLHAQIWLWAMHRFFRAVTGISARTLIDPSPFLRSHGFRCVKREHWRLGLVATELWQRIR